MNHINLHNSLNLILFKDSDGFIDIMENFNTPSAHVAIQSLAIGGINIVGRTTWESANYLNPNEQFVVVSRDVNYESPKPCILVEDFNQALCVSGGYSNLVFLRGGLSIINSGLVAANRIIMVEVEGKLGAEHRPNIVKKDWKIKPITDWTQYAGDSHRYRIQDYTRR